MIRPYREKDLEQCIRILNEVGWMEGEDTDKEAFKAYASDSLLNVVELDGEVEVLVLTRTGIMQYLNSTIPFSGVTGVVASRVARTKGWSLKTTASAIAETVEAGAQLSVLGMFDQGYYDKIGFGTLPYHRISTFDPAMLKVPKLSRKPVRLSKEHAKEMHDCRLRRLKGHGACNMHGEGITECELIWQPKGVFGLGFRDDSGTLTHFFSGKAKGEHGPYNIHCIAYESYDQFAELLSLLKSLSDQVHGVRMADPPNLQLQDFLERPMATWRSRKGGTFASSELSIAWMQCRINSVESCVGHMKIHGKPLSFQLHIDDPIKQYLPTNTSWEGEGGDWIITLGDESTATRGTDSTLPALSASINGFSRLWIGASNATALNAVGQLDGENALLQQLDECIRLPMPAIDWDF